MKKMNKVVLTALVALFGVSALSGCGQKDDGITVVFWHTFGKTIQDTLARKITEFEKLVLEHDGVKVHIDQNYRGGYDDILSQISQGWAAGNVPTMAVAYPDHVADYIDSEEYSGQHVVNLDDYINDPEVGFGQEKWLGDTTTGTSDFIPAYFEEGQSFVVEGTYTLPLMKSTEVMFYNINVVDPLLDDMRQLEDTSEYYIPELSEESDNNKLLSSISWDELMKIGDYFLNEWESSYKPDTIDDDFYPVFYDSDGNLFITKMMQNEIPYSSVNYVTNKGSIDFQTGDARIAAEAMVTSLSEYHDKGVLTTKGAIGEYGSNYFVDGKALFSIGSSGGTGYQLPSSNSFDVGVCAVPADNDNPLYVCQGPDLVLLRNPKLKDSENDERDLYAWKFMKYLTNPDVNVELCTYGSEGYSPVRQSAYTTDEYLEYLEEGEEYADTAKVVLNDIGTNYFTTAVFPGSATLRDQVGGIITEVLTGSASVTDAFETAISRSLLAM
ncbi:MAG: extracellular solute-binding protein [Coprobacillus sp.]|nr:extracellular solute-binding protein [Coprobacillus sp.]